MLRFRNKNINIFTKKELSRLYWLVGSVCGGKTTISTPIAERLNWNVYHCDKYFNENRKKASPKKHPTFYKISQITGDELWLRPLDEQILMQIAFEDEEFIIALEELSKMLKEDDRSLIFDGHVSPKTLPPFLYDKNHAFYLVATEKFQIGKYSQRPEILDVLNKTSNKKLAWYNWMQRDMATARSIKEQAKQKGLSCLSVDGSLSIEETYNKIIKQFTML